MKTFIKKHSMALLSFAALVVVVVVWAIPMLVYGTPSPSPTPFETIGDAVSEVAAAVAATKGQIGDAAWMAWAALVAGVLKAFWMLVGRIPALAKKIKEWGVEANLVIPALIAVAYVVGSKDWLGAVALVFEGPLMGFAHDIGRYVWKLKKKAGPSADLDDGTE